MNFNLLRACGGIMCLGITYAAVETAITVRQARTVWVTNAGEDVHKTVVNVNETVLPALTSNVGQLTTATAELGGALGQMKGLIDDARPTIRKLPETVQKANDAIDNTNHRVNDLCPTPAQSRADPKLRCGVIAELDTSLGASRTVMERTGLAIDRFDKHEDDLFAQETAFYATGIHAAAAFDAIVSSKSFQDLPLQTDRFLQTGNQILVIGRDVADKETHCIRHPGFKCTVTGIIVPTIQIGGAVGAALR